jgi:hypothetical protein
MVKNIEKAPTEREKKKNKWDYKEE